VEAWAGAEETCEETDVTSASLQELSNRLAKLLDDLPNNEGIVDVFDFLLGAIYSLQHLEGVFVWNRRGQHFPNYKIKVSLYLSEYGENHNQHWINGYFLNSALQRIAGCYDRIPKLLSSSGGERETHPRMQSFLGISDADNQLTKWWAVYKEVNILKHDQQGLATGRSVTKDDAVQALSEIVSALENKVGELKSLA
jgi:hypothetical protein